jgi:hypothetical protein
LGDAPTTLLSGEEGDKEPPALFVESSDQPIDQLMLFGDCTLGATSTVRTTTAMNDFCHTLTPAISKMRARLLYAETVKLFSDSPYIRPTELWNARPDVPLPIGSSPGSSAPTQAFLSQS